MSEDHIILNKKGPGIRSWSTLFWKVVMGLAVLSGISGIGLFMEDRYVNTPELAQAETRMLNKLDQREQNANQKYLLFTLSLLENRKLQLKLYLKKNPNDGEVKRQYNEACLQIRKTKDALRMP